MDFFENDLQFTKIIFKDRFYYPPEINASIHDLISYFRANIVSNTPFIYLFAPNHIKTIIAYFAIIKSGHVCVLVEPDIGRLELAEMKQDTPPCALVHIERTTDSFDYNTEIVFTRDNPQEFDWDELSDVATIVYTNAEDGYAKGAMLTRKNLLANAEGGLNSNRTDYLSVLCALVPFHHLFGFQVGVITSLFVSSQTGSVTLIEDISELREIRKIAEDFIKYGITNLYSIPIVYHLFTRFSDIKSIFIKANKICSGGYKLPDLTYDKFLVKTGKPILEGYGITEASPVCSWYHDDNPIKRGSVGKAYSCCDIKIFNKASQECANGECGEICIKGDNIMKGYYNNKTATQKILKNNWLYTGDLGKVDIDGYIYLTGLKKRMLNINGRKVYQAEVERLLKKHKNIKTIEVYGAPHTFQNDIVKANIELKIKGPKHEDIFRKWSVYSIGRYKFPKTITFA
jgi:long-chain acyl-CoA synthetase